MLLDKPISIIDIETTGMSSARNSITEIGIIKIDNGVVIDEYHTLVNPGRDIPQQITRITGIDNLMVKSAPYFADISERINDIFEDAYFMAHNVIFDFSFVKRQMKMQGYDFKPRLLCSVKLSRAIESDVKGHSLEKIISRNNIKVNARHRALDDAKVVKEYLDILTRRYGNEVVVEKLNLQLEYKSLPSNLDTSFLEGVGNTPGVYIFKDSDGLPIYVGKSINLRNRVLSHFSQSTELNKEMKISMNTHSLEIMNTDSEIEALLLESKLIKELLPIYNRKLRRKRKQTILQKKVDADGYYTIKLFDGKVEEIESTNEIYGVYDNRISAKKALERHRDTFNLCSKLLGLEKTQGACFRYQLGKCSGACIGKIEPALSNVTMELAFEKSRLESWKYPGPIHIKISDNKALVINEWKIIKTIYAEDDNVTTSTENSLEFDIDNYKIISSFIRRNPNLVSNCSFSGIF